MGCLASFAYEPLEGGIATLAWGPEGYQLLVNERYRPHQLLEISFAKSIDGDHRVPRVDIVDSTRLQEEEVNVLQVTAPPSPSLPRLSSPHSTAVSS